MWSALIGLTPWMAMAAEPAPDDPVAATLRYTYSQPELDPPAYRLGDECFIPVKLAHKIGWEARVRGAKATVKVAGRSVDTFVRDVMGHKALPVRGVLTQVGGLSSWAAADELHVYSKLQSISVANGRLEVSASLPVHGRVFSLVGPNRVVLDLSGARVDPSSPPKVAGDVRFAQFDSKTVRVVAQLDGPPQLKPLQGVPGRSVAAEWTGAKPVAVEPLKPSPPAPEPLELEGLSLAEEDKGSVLRVGITGPAPPTFNHQRDRDGTYWIHLPSASRREGAGPLEVSGRDVKSAAVQDRPGGGLSLKLELKRAMGVRASSAPGELVVRMTVPKNGSGAIGQKTIVIDPGHGGPRSGAIGREGATVVYEKDLTLQIARLVKEELALVGATVLMTRDSDIALDPDNATDLAKRAELANASGADFFISIHINSNAVDNSRSGSAVYYHFKDLEARTSEDCRLFAECLQAELARATGLPTQGAVSDKTAAPTSGFSVLRRTLMPAVLVEVAYINNAADRELLKKQDFQRKVAAAIVEGVRVYIGETSKERG